MSGLLMRLGAQATGSGWAVHSDVRLPFGAYGPGPALATAPAENTSPGPVAADAGEAWPAPVATAPRRAPRTPPQPASETGPMATATENGPVPRGSRDDRQPVPSPLVPLSTETAVIGRTRAMPQPLSRAAKSEPTQDKRPSAAANLPEALLPGPPPNGHRRLAPPPLTAPHTQARGAFGQPISGAEADRETEVHIHIGRIEVTALQEAARPKPKQRERAQPMSLDAYLEQRRKVS